MTVDEDEHNKITVRSSDNINRLSVPLILRSYTPKQLHLQKSNPNRQFSPSNDYIHRLIEQNERRYEQQELNATIGQEWQILGRVIDRLLVYIFLIGTMLVFVVIFGQAPHLRLK